jgi:hypothetical protein
MKKGLVIGCAAVLLLLVVAGGFAWFRVLAPAFKAGSELVGLARHAEQLVRLDNEIRNQSPYAPPADGALSPDQVDTVLNVQRHIRAGMAQRMSELDQRYKALEADIKASGRQPGIAELAQAYGDLFGLLVEAKRLQVEALNRQGVSLAEYQWARAQTLHAAGMRASGLLQLDEGLQQQLRAHHRVPEGNLALVQDHAAELLENALIASLGL